MRAPILVLALAAGGCTSDGKGRGKPGTTDSATTDSPVTGTGTGTTTGTGSTDTATTVGPQLPLSATDIGLEAGFQQRYFGHFNRSRALITADFDNDGRIDVYVGNVGDPNVVLRNVPDPTHGVRFELVQSFLDTHLSWGGSAADYDNDGDVDLFISGGGNQCYDTDHLMRNEFMETGELTFTDVSAQAGVTSWNAEPQASASAVWADVNNDGWVDLFVNGYHDPPCDMDRAMGRNTIWLNNQDGTFTDATEALGLGAEPATTMNSALFDIDNDGDMDLYETNRRIHPIRLWRNTLAETGTAGFVDITHDPERIGDDVSVPDGAFGACARDLDGDGWEDFVVFDRRPPLGDLDTRTHHVYLNLEGKGFEAVGNHSGLVADEVPAYGVMGCQLGDLNGDGWYEAFAGNGGPEHGASNELYFGQAGGRSWVDGTSFIDVPAITDDSGPFQRAFPYRTHGTSMVDVTGDLVPELLIVNGGPEYRGPDVQEPNRLFTFTWADPPRFLVVHPEGDGVRVNRDGIGARLALLVRDPDGSERTLHRTQYGGSCFSAHTSFDLSFGLGDATELLRLDVAWPDGTTTGVVDGLEAGTRITVRYGQ